MNITKKFQSHLNDDVPLQHRLLWILELNIVHINGSESEVCGNLNLPVLHLVCYCIQVSVHPFIVMVQMLVQMALGIVRQR